jgi:hypothetical protein
MKGKGSSIFWGILFILAGVALLAQLLGWVDFSRFSTNTWVYIFAGGGLIFLLAYFISGIRNWGMLFPALIFLSIGLIIWLSDRGEVGAWIGMPILLSVAIPFYIGFLLDRKAWGLLIPAWVLTVISFVTLAADSSNGTLIGALFLYAVAAPFLIVFLMNRTRLWALIPAWAMFILGTITLLADHVDGNLIGALFMYGVALPFLVVYLLDRNRRWALIPAVAVAFVGTIPLLAGVVGGDWMGLAVMLLFSAAFFIVYFRWQNTWWALIPAGIFASIALVVLLGMIVPQNQPIFQGILTGVLLIGFGLTFGALWLLRQKYSTGWARYPAICLLIAGVLACFFGSNNNLFWAIALLVLGVVLVVYSFLRRRPSDQA